MDLKYLTIFNKFLDSSRQGKRVNFGVELILVLGDTLGSSGDAFPDDVPDKTLETQDSTLQAVQIFQLDLNKRKDRNIQSPDGLFVLTSQ